MNRRDFLEQWGLASLKINLAIPVLNQVIRPFTARWHRLSLAGAFSDAGRCAEFRAELAALQPQLRNYTRALAAMAQVEDLTGLEDTGHYPPP